MGLPLVELNEYDSLVGVVAILIILLGLNDLIPMFENNRNYFRSMLPFRMFTSFGVCTFCVFGSNPLVCNGLVFCYFGIETVLNFIMYNKNQSEMEVEANTIVEENQRRAVEELERSLEDIEEDDENEDKEDSD